jgi:ankyrin repeat protein
MLNAAMSIQNLKQLVVILLLLLSARSFGQNNSNIYKARDSSLTKLHSAVIQGHYAEVLDFIALRENINKKDIHGYTVLDYALGSNNPDNSIIAGALKKVGAIESRPFGLSLIKNNKSLNLSLVKNNSNIDKARYDSLTKLHLAAIHGYYADVLKLIRLKANVNKKDMHGYTALDFALGSNDPDSSLIVEALKKSGAIESRPWGKSKWDTLSYEYYEASVITYPVSFFVLFLVFSKILKANNSMAVLSFSISWLIVLSIHTIPNLIYGRIMYVYYEWRVLVATTSVPMILLSAYVIGINGNGVVLKVANIVTYTIIIIFVLFCLLMMLGLSSS